MIDPLENFDFASIYQQYNNFTRDYRNFNNELERMGLPSEITDLKLYYHLKEKFGADRININIYDYIAMLFWKLNFIGLNKIWRVLLENEEKRNIEAKKLKNLFKLFSNILDRSIDKVEQILQEQNYQLYGMASPTAWPTRSVFLHFLYPNIIPIFDQMVLRAIEPNYQKNYSTRKDKFLEYIEFVWKLTERYVKQIKEIKKLKDTDIRIIEMALWIKGHNVNHNY